MGEGHRALVWDDFWKDQQYDPLHNIADPQSHSDISWKISLDFWGRQFARAPGRSLLECGCGAATLSRFMARHGYQCTMLDNSQEGLSRARDAFRKEQAQGVFVHGDILDMDLPDGSFDIVYCGGVLEFFEDIRQPIREMVRVLRPNGILGINVVPGKLSVQSLADIERTVAHTARSMAAGRPREAFQRMRSVPSRYHVNAARLEDYLRACREAGIGRVRGLYTNPFPALSLPPRLSTLYSQLLRKLIPTWKKFNCTYAAWKRAVGITYTIVGKK
jgi:SAM-dependent methyltransferase